MHNDEAKIKHVQPALNLIDQRHFLHRGWDISTFSFTSPNKQDFRRSRVCLSGNRTPNVAVAESLSGDPFIALRCLVLQPSRVAKYYRTDHDKFVNDKGAT